MTTLRPADARRGSILLVALTILAILTVVGLSLVVITETEVLLGSAERVLGETSEVSEAALSASVAQLAVTNSFDARTLYMSSSYDKRRAEDQNDGSPDELNHLGYELRSSGLTPLVYDELPYSSEAEGGNNFYGAYIVGAYRALRIGWPGDEPVPEEDCTGVEVLATTQYQLTGFFFGPTNQPPGGDLTETSLESRDQGRVDFFGFKSGSSCGDALAEAVASGSTWGTNVDPGDIGRGGHMVGAAIEATSGFFR